MRSNPFSIEDLPDLPDLPHARQLKAGIPWLSFDGELEPEFRRSHLDEALVHVRANLCLAITIVLAFTAANALVFGHELNRIPSILNMLVIMPMLLLVLGASFSPIRHRAYPPLALVAAVVYGLSQVVIQIVASRGHIGFAFPSLLLATMYVYFMSGLIFYHAAAANAIMLFIYVAAASAFDVPGPEFSYNTLAIVAANLVGASVVYMHERTSRMRFLEAGLLREMVARDGLTGIHNRRMFNQHMQRIWSLAVREAEMIAVLLIDIDCFKDYNDRYGHQAGDECLRAVGRCLNVCARRPLDMVARYGGEEFAVVLYEAGAEYVAEVLTRIQRSVAELNIPHEASRVATRLTVSVGAAYVAPSAHRTHEGLVQLADEALYKAKEQGRNRVVVMQSEYHSLKTGRFDKRRAQSSR